MPKTIALLHPGDMGAGMGGALAAAGHTVYCALKGRSETTRRRAAEAKLIDAGTLQSAVAQAEVVLSVCPPHGALELAREVAKCGFKGLFIDANAIAPATARMAAMDLQEAGATFVDGGIVGGPPTPARPGRIYFSGPSSAQAVELFKGTYVVASDLDGPVGKASAFKACFASWTKGTWALLAAIYAVAQAEGVDDALRVQWAKTHPDLVKQLDEPSVNPAKAWRWISEMEEISLTYKSVGLPEEFFTAAADLYRRLEQYKDDASRPSIDQVSQALRKKNEIDI